MPWSKIKIGCNEPFSTECAAGDERLIAYPDAIREGLHQCLALDPSVFVMGQGVDDPAGMFGTTRGLCQEFGHARVFDTPLAETGLMGVAVGAALGGMRPVYMHNRPDFLLLAMDQLVNHAAKWHFMFGGAASVPLVVWACTGRGWGSAAQHSQALQGLFMHVPGLKLVMPATCQDAKGLLIAAIKDDNPVLILDHRFNFSHQGHVPEPMYATPMGKAIVRKPGRDVTVVAISHMVHEAWSAAQELAEAGIDVEIIDLRSLCPLDEKTIIESVSRTGRAVIADTGWKRCGAAAEIAALCAEKCVFALKAPVLRVANPDLPTPAACSLEDAYYAGKTHIADAVRQLMNGR